MRRFNGPLLAGLALGLCVFFAPFCALPASAAPTAATASNPNAVRAYAGVLQKINPMMPAWQSHDLAKHLLINANRWKIDANMLVALVTVESSWHTHARSYVGAMGLGQLMPGTAALLHVNPHDPYQNLQGAARYLYGLLTRYRDKPNRFALAFAAYNAGPHAVAKFGGIPPYAETQNYVVKVMDTWQKIRGFVHFKPQQLAAKRSILLSSISPDTSYWTGTYR